MPTLVEQQVEAVLRERTQHDWWVPEEHQLLIETARLALEAARLDDPEQDLSALEQALADAEQAGRAAGFPVRWVHASDAAMQRLQRDLVANRAAVARREDIRQYAKDFVDGQLAGLSHDQLVELMLEWEGRGSAYLDETLLSTPRQLLAAVTERWRGDLRRLEELLGPTAPDLLDIIVEALASIDAVGASVQWDDYPRGDFAIYFTEAERHELAEAADDGASDNAQRIAAVRDAIIARHLAIERPLREEEVASRRAALKAQSYDELVAGMVARTREGRADSEALDRYQRELLRIMTQSPLERDADGAWRLDGPWGATFSSAAMVERVQLHQPGLYRFLLAGAKQLLPSNLDQLALSAPFRDALGPL